jgi:diphthamide synthase (EF-2-diphthine--ammonia ligase)
MGRTSVRVDVLLSWSGGKDSSLALLEIARDDRYNVRALLTTVTEGYERVSMHGVRRTLLATQAASLGLPLEEVWIPKRAPNEIYESRIGDILVRYRDKGIEQVIFGDLFLRDIRSYREERLV